ncbi:MAG: hypothetical protein ACJ76Y_13625 [Thermoanaerobaculia bacterium]
MRAKLALRRVRTEARFRGADPWNGNVPADLSIEAYYLVPEHVREVPSPCPWGDTPVYALRSGIDGAERFLPDSLGHLWKTGKVAAEALPGLLREMEPDLAQADFRPVLGAPPGRRVTAVLVLLLIAMVGVLLTWPRGSGSFGGPVLLCGAALAGGILGALLTFPPYCALWGRRRRQTVWVIERLSGRVARSGVRPPTVWRSVEASSGRRPRP